MKLEVVIRNDLNMRKGKMAAQACHAVMKRVLDACTLKADGLHIRAEDFALLRRFSNVPEIEVVLVANEEELYARTAINPMGVIVDHGHTEFHGVHTPTCGAVGLHEIEPTVHVDGRNVHEAQDRSMIARQWLVFARPGSTGEDFSKEKIVELACLATITHMLHLFQRQDEDHYAVFFEQYPALGDWLHGAFGKIGLVVKDKAELLVLEELAKQEGAHVSLHTKGVGTLIVGPEYPDSVSCLRELKLL